MLDDEGDTLMGPPTWPSRPGLDAGWDTIMVHHEGDTQMCDAYDVGMPMMCY